MTTTELDQGVFLIRETKQERYQEIERRLEEESEAPRLDADQQERLRELRLRRRSLR